MHLVIQRLGLYTHHHGGRVNDWIHVPAQDGFLLDGRTWPPEEFNALMKSRRWEKLVEDHGYRIRIQCVVVGRGDGEAVSGQD